MCGIIGIVKKNGDRVDPKQLASLNDLAAHRGPDGAGVYVAENVGFAHRRLSIIDLSDTGKQPMYYDDLVITFNGEIYNYLELRQELKLMGHIFHTDSDTEVILVAYKAWGVNCVARFNGMWAFAIHDVKSKILFISRDRFGVKPLYLFSDNETFAFSSEIRQLLPLTKLRIADRQILFDYLMLGQQNHNNDSFFKDIKKFPQSHSAVYDLTSNTMKQQRYYQLQVDPDVRKLNVGDAIQLYKENLYRSISLRLRSDVTVGTCLSGGLDSSLIAAIASQEYHKVSAQKFKAITAQSIEKETDESYYAKLVVDQHELDWSTTQPEIADINAVVDEVIRTQEEPFLSLSIVMQYFVMKKAREAGCIVLLDGQGGDETLLGYERYYSAYLDALPFFKAFTQYFDISKNSKLSLKDIFQYRFYFTNALLRGAVTKSRAFYIKKEYRSFFNYSLIKSVSESYQSIETMQRNEIEAVQLPKLLNYEDRNSMKHGIEARVPFLDYQLVEVALSIPALAKINHGWTKYPLRMIGKDILPAEVVWRKNKFGFEAPRATWQKINNKVLFDTIEKSPFVNEIVEKRKLKEIKSAETLWKLYNIAKWSEFFQVSW